MFDSLREPENDQKSFEEAMGFGPTATVKPETRSKAAARGLFGLSAFQRFVLALMLLLAVVVLGTMCLLITGRISAF